MSEPVTFNSDRYLFKKLIPIVEEFGFQTKLLIDPEAGKFGRITAHWDSDIDSIEVDFDIDGFKYSKKSGEVGAGHYNYLLDTMRSFFNE